MTKPICVHGDIAIGTCFSHGTPLAVTGTVDAVESFCAIQGINVALDGDIVNFNCGHTGVCVASSEITKIKNKKVVLSGDSVTNGTGIITATITTTQVIAEAI